MNARACRKCRKLLDDIFVDKKESREIIKECPICGSNTFTTFWKGNTLIIDPENSEVAKAMGVKTPGRYVLRISR